MLEIDLCRICLVDSVKMYPMEKTFYNEVFEWYTEDTLDMSCELPYSVCYLCNALLERLYRFLRSMVNMEVYLKEVLRNDEKLSPESVERVKEQMKKPHNLSKVWLRNSNFVALEAYKGNQPPWELWKLFKEPPIMIEYHIPNKQIMLDDISEGIELIEEEDKTVNLKHDLKIVAHIPAEEREDNIEPETLKTEEAVTFERIQTETENKESFAHVKTSTVQRDSGPKENKNKLADELQKSKQAIDKEIDISDDIDNISLTTNEINNKITASNKEENDDTQKPYNISTRTSSVVSKEYVKSDSKIIKTVLDNSHDRTQIVTEQNLERKETETEANKSHNPYRQFMEERKMEEFLDTKTKETEFIEKDDPNFKTVENCIELMSENDEADREIVKDYIEISSDDDTKTPKTNQRKAKQTVIKSFPFYKIGNGQADIQYLVSPCYTKGTKTYDIKQLNTETNNHVKVTSEPSKKYLNTFIEFIGDNFQKKTPPFVVINHEARHVTKKPPKRQKLQEPAKLLNLNKSVSQTDSPRKIATEVVQEHIVNRGMPKKTRKLKNLNSEKKLNFLRCTTFLTKKQSENLVTIENKNVPKKKIFTTTQTMSKNPRLSNKLRQKVFVLSQDDAKTKFLLQKERIDQTKKAPVNKYIPVQSKKKIIIKSDSIIKRPQLSREQSDAPEFLYFNPYLDEVLKPKGTFKNLNKHKLKETNDDNTTKHNKDDPQVNITKKFYYFEKFYNPYLEFAEQEMDIEHEYDRDFSEQVYHKEHKNESDSAQETYLNQAVEREVAGQEIHTKQDQRNSVDQESHTKHKNVINIDDSETESASYPDMSDREDNTWDGDTPDYLINSAHSHTKQCEQEELKGQRKFLDQDIHTENKNMRSNDVSDHSAETESASYHNMSDQEGQMGLGTIQSQVNNAQSNATQIQSEQSHTTESLDKETHLEHENESDSALQRIETNRVLEREFPENKIHTTECQKDFAKQEIDTKQIKESVDQKTHAEHGKIRDDGLDDFSDTETAPYHNISDQEDHTWDEETINSQVNNVLKLLDKSLADDLDETESEKVEHRISIVKTEGEITKDQTENDQNEGRLDLVISEYRSLVGHEDIDFGVQDIDGIDIKIEPIEEFQVETDDNSIMDEDETRSFETNDLIDTDDIKIEVDEDGYVPYLEQINEGPNEEFNYESNRYSSDENSDENSNDIVQNVTAEQDLYKIRDLSKLCYLPTVTLERLSEEVIHQYDRGDNHIYSCIYCTFKAYNENSLIRHQEAHNSHKRIPCNLCSNRYKYAKSLHTHKYVKHGLRLCNTCNKYFHRNKMTSHNQRVHNIYKHVCSICHRGYRGKRKFNEHMLLHNSRYITFHKTLKAGEKPFQCKMCGKSFYRRSNCYKHIKHKHPEAIEEERNYPCILKKNDTEIICGICQQVFITKEELKQHALSHIL